MDPESVAEAAAAIAAGEVSEAEHSQRVKSEVFDNPIYDQAPLPRKKKNGSVCSSVRTGDIGSVSSVRSFSVSSSQNYNYSPPSVRAVEKINQDDTAHHDYEDVKTNFDEMPRLASSFQGSAQHMYQSDKLTVINESYDSLPCSGDNSFSLLPHSRLQASSVPNCTVGDGHGLAGRPIITEVNISEAFSKRKKAGSEPSTQEYHDLGANSCHIVEIDIETTEQ